MGSLLYYPGWEDARARLTTWWNGGDIGRPAMQYTAPRDTPWEDVPALPEPEGWITDYSTKSLPYRVNLALRSCLRTDGASATMPTPRPPRSAGASSSSSSPT